MYRDNPLVRGRKLMMMRRVLVLAGLVWVGTALPAYLPALAADEDVGAVEQARGLTMVVRQDVIQPLQLGSGVQVLDHLQTGDNARLHVVFVDGSDLSMGAGSDLIVDEMVYEPGNQGQGVLHLSQGVFRLVSGQVNKVPGGTLTILTPLATIGVRGTDFWGHQTSEKLDMALLDDGELTITTAQGQVTLTDPLSAVTVLKGQPPSAIYTLSPEQLSAAKATVAW